MAIKSKFIIFDTLSNFLSTNGIGGTAPSTDYIGNIPKGAVVFIKNTGLIWFNGTYFGPNINNYYTKTLIDNKLDRKQDEYYRQYLTFTALLSSTFTFSTNALQYSLDDGSTWETLAADTASPTVSAGNKILWKARLTPVPFSHSGIGTFSATGSFEVSGNIMSLCYGDNFIGQKNLTRDLFYRLFNGNTKLVNAKNLILPATTLTDNCYRQMFQGCTSLTAAPELPATTLAEHCYDSMFNGCTSLTTAPQLLATTLADQCYAYMFSGCTSLTTAPVLSATTLASACYRYMFSNCTSLTEAPKLPATILANYCYAYMFNYCRSLNHIECLATDISAKGCTLGWVQGVASSGTFVKAASMSSWTTGNNGIPSGWIVCTEDEYKEIRHYELGGTVSGKNYPVLLDTTTNKLYVNVPLTDNNTTSFTITANATDGLWDITGTNGTNAVTYAVGAYGSQQSKASFDTSSTAPTRSDRLNYNGYFYATKLFSGGVEVLTSHQSLANYLPLSGGTIDGNLTVNGNTTLNKHITINPYSSSYGSNPVQLYWNDVKHTIIGNTKLDGTNNTAVDFLHSGNSSSAASSAVQLSFGETSKLATINGVDVKVTMPSQTTFVGYKFNDSIGGRNYFSKNTVVGSNITKTTSINGYTINSSNGINRILNLGFNGYVGNWTVTFELKASAACSVNVNLCDTSASTAHGEQSTTSVTTEYVKHRYVFLNVSRYNTAENNGYNGFLDIENSENKTIYVKDIKIEKGIIASDWFYAPEDLATQTWVGSLITNGNVSLLSGFKVNEWGFLYKYMHSASTSFLNGFFYITIEFDGSNTHWEEIYILSESSSDTNLRIELVRSDGLRVYNSNTGSMGGLFSSITTRGISVSGKTIIALSSNGYATRYGQLYFTVNVYSKYKDFTLTIANNSLYDVVSNTDDIINLGYSNTTTTYLNDQNVNGTVYPAITNKHNLGLPSYKWNNLYLSNNLSDGTNSLTVANIKSTYDWYQTMTTGNTDGTINKWKEIESFVNGISDTSTLNGILAGYVPKRYSNYFYPFVKAINYKQYYKITLPWQGYTSSANAWMMTTMELVVCGSYNSGNNGRIYLQYYFLKNTSNVWSAASVYGVEIGYRNYENGILIKYNIANPGIMYITANANIYNTLAIENVSANDTACNFDFRNITIEAIDSIPSEATGTVPIYHTITTQNIESLLPERLRQSCSSSSYTSYNDATISGWHFINASSDGPFAHMTGDNNQAMLSVTRYDANWCAQIAQSFYHNAIAYRTKKSGTWSYWAEFIPWSQSEYTNLNDVDRTGIFTHSEFTNRPTGVANWGSVLTIKLYRSNNSYHRQLFFDCYGTDKIWTRSNNGGTWTDWTEVITAKNIGNYAITSHQSLSNYYTKTDSDSRYLNANVSSSESGWGLYNFRKDISSTKTHGQEDNSVVDLLHMAQLRVMNSSNVWCTTIGVRDGLGWIDCVGSGLGYGDLYLKPTNSGAAIVGNYNGMGYKFSKNNLTEKFIVFGNERIVGNSTITDNLTVKKSATLGGNGLQYPLLITRAYNDSVCFRIGSKGSGNDGLTMRIDNNGSGGGNLVYIDLKKCGAGVEIGPSLTVSGSVSAVDFTATSDIRLKRDIQQISDHIYSFRFKDSDKLHYGFIALELEKEHPDLVGLNEYKTVNYNSALSLYIAELENRVKILENEINNLKNK